MPVSKKQKSLSIQEIYQKITAWCAYQDRCHAEVRDKLYSYELKTDDINEIISKLIQESYLNEERFARSYAGGKFRIKKWGRKKILSGLKQKSVSPNCIKLGMQEIDEQDYELTMLMLIEKKNKELGKEKNDYIRNNKIAEYLIRKGYEPDMVWDIIKNICS
jgi:regulatory protein